MWPVGQASGPPGTKLAGACGGNKLAGAGVAGLLQFLRLPAWLPSPLRSHPPCSSRAATMPHFRTKAVAKFAARFVAVQVMQQPAAYYRPPVCDRPLEPNCPHVAGRMSCVTPCRSQSFGGPQPAGSIGIGCQTGHCKSRAGTQQGRNAAGQERSRAGTQLSTERQALGCLTGTCLHKDFQQHSTLALLACRDQRQRVRKSVA